MRHTKFYSLLLAFLVLSVTSYQVASGYNNPSLEWRTLKTEHFEVHYHQGSEWTAFKVAEVAEEVHGALTEFYRFEPDNPVHFIIRDTHDYANGAAYFFDRSSSFFFSPTLKRTFSSSTTSPSSSSGALSR